MKAGSIGDTDIYLGAKVKKMRMNNGVTAWAIIPSKNVNEAVNNCEKWIWGTCQSTSIEAEPPIHYQQIMALIQTQQMDLMKTKQHIINPNWNFALGC